MKKSLLVAFLTIFMAAAATVSAEASQYFKVDKTLRQFTEMSPNQAMRNDRVMTKLNKTNSDYGFAIYFNKTTPDLKERKRIFENFKKNNPGKTKGYFIIYVDKDLRAAYCHSSQAVGDMVNDILEKSSNPEKVMAGPLVYNTVETMKHR